MTPHASTRRTGRAIVSLLCTRPEGEDDPLVARLRALGYRVHAAPTVTTERAAFAPPDLAAFDWVVVTSATGVEALLAAARPAGAARWAAVGPRTAAALAGRGITAAAVPAEARAVSIAGAIAAREPLPGLRVLLARADAAAGDLPAALREAGAAVEELAVYRTVVGPDASRPAVREALADPDLAAVLFASGSAVRGLVTLAEHDPRSLAAITIGPATTAVARAEGFRVVAEAARPGVDGLVQAVTAWRPPDLMRLC
jgi:uroporphyrinogen III methyltransferase / synthase